MITKDKLKEYAEKAKLYSLFQILTKLINDLKYSDFARYVFEFAVIKASNISSIINIIDGNSPVSAPVKKVVTAPLNKANENTDIPVRQEAAPAAQEKTQEIEPAHSTDTEVNNEPVPVLKGSDEGIWTSIPSSHTSQPKPHAPNVGDSQSSSTNLMSWSNMLIPNASRLFKYSS